MLTENRILIVYAGGTIGMQNTENGFVPVSGFGKVIQEQLHPPLGYQLPDYDVIEIEPVIDSANLIPCHWNTLAATIIDNYEDYDGFIVMHGTDTMAYSASALSFLLIGLEKPVIFTGSQIPLVEPRSDAQENLCNALITAAYYPVPEVTIVFNGKLIRGNRSTKSKSTGLDAFESPNFPWLGQLSTNVEIHSELFLPRVAKQFSNPIFGDQSVAILPIYPGFDGNLIQWIAESKQLDGLIVQSYGVGNLPDQNHELLKAIESATDRGCIVLNISQCLQAEVYHGHYASSSQLDEIGVISGANMTREAAYTKMLYLLASGYEREVIGNKFACSLAGEVDT